jgi:hypothetical protein
MLETPPKPAPLIGREETGHYASFVLPFPPLGASQSLSRAEKRLLVASPLRSKRSDYVCFLATSGDGA